MSDLFVRFRVTICGIPELDAHGAAGVTHVLSILDPQWPDPTAFATFSPHRRLALRFHDIIEPAAGHDAPTRDDVIQLLAFGQEVNEPGGHLLIHCHAGISRSTAAATLILAQAHPDRSAEAILAAVTQIRPRAWPNLRMLEFGDALLGRGNTLVAAVAPIYRRVIERDPGFHDAIIAGGRSREVEMALNSPAPAASPR